MNSECKPEEALKYFFKSKDFGWCWQAKKEDRCYKIGDSHTMMAILHRVVNVRSSWSGIYHDLRLAEDLYELNKTYNHLEKAYTEEKSNSPLTKKPYEMYALAERIDILKLSLGVK